MKGTLLFTPPVQTIVGAPLALGVTTVWLQVVAGVAVATSTGAGFTVTSTVAVPVHPLASVPVTE
ncbi:MAG: hypothetical protein IPJ31_16540 [Bacteroidetes bacterium]|nr:hypothetical protein [Bacteroidota bacterium]